MSLESSIEKLAEAILALAASKSQKCCSEEASTVAPAKAKTPKAEKAPEPVAPVVTAPATPPPTAEKDPEQTPEPAKATTLDTSVTLPIIRAVANELVKTDAGKQSFQAFLGKYEAKSLSQIKPEHYTAALADIKKLAELRK